MKLSALFEKKVYIRLADDQPAFVCTAKWPLFTNVKRVSISEASPDLAAQVAEVDAQAWKDLPIFRHNPPE
jgi:hypothetical protein